MILTPIIYHTKKNKLNALKSWIKFEDWVEYKVSQRRCFLFYNLTDLFAALDIYIFNKVKQTFLILDFSKRLFKCTIP